MPITEFLEKPLPELRLAARTATVSDQAQVGGHIGPSFAAVAEVIGDSPGALDTPVACYTSETDGLRIVVGYAYDGEPHEAFSIVHLAGQEHALCTAHHGPVTGIHESWQALHAEMVSRGLEPSGPCRELYVRAESEDQHDWITELQQPVRDAG
ncbi:GyrI-like domain-containing protein [Nesterenkonia suensis]